MRRVFYAGAEFTASDELATELVELAIELTARGATQKVSVPVITAEGAIDQVTMILGPPAAMVSTPDPTAAESDMAEAVAQVKAMRAEMAVRRSRTVALSDADWALSFDVEY